MSKLQNTINEHAFNEAEMFDRIRLQNLKKERMIIFMNKKLWISLGVAAAMLLTIAGGAALLIPSQQKAKTEAEAMNYAQLKYSEHPLAAAMVSVDINPSFEIYTDADGKVVEIKAVNDDARTLNVTALVGLPVDDAVSGIITLATAAGFINEKDDVEDYVIVSTVMLDTESEDAAKKQDALDEMITKGLADDTTLPDTTKVAVIKGTQVEMFLANGKDVPMGLYVINGMISKDGVMIPVSEFVSNSDNLKKLKNRAVIVEKGNKNKTDESTDQTATTQETAAADKEHGNSGSNGNAVSSSAKNKNAVSSQTAAVTSASGSTDASSTSENPNKGKKDNSVAAESGSIITNPTAAETTAAETTAGND